MLKVATSTNIFPRVSKTSKSFSMNRQILCREQLNINTSEYMRRIVVQFSISSDTLGYITNIYYYVQTIREFSVAMLTLQIFKNFIEFLTFV